MINLPIAVSVPASAASRRAQATALQQNAGLPGAAQADENSFHDAMLQMLGKGSSATGDTTAASATANGSGRTSAERTDPAQDAIILPDGRALPLPLVLASAKLAAAGGALDANTLPLLQALASALVPAANRQATLSTVAASSKASPDLPTGADTAPVVDANTLSLLQALASALVPAANRQATLSTVAASSKASPDLPTSTDTALALDASAVPAGLTHPGLLAKAAPANALSAVHSEPLKDVLATPVLDTSSFRAELPVPSVVAAPAAEIGSSAPTRGVPEPSATVQTRVGERGWDQAVADKLVWMVDQKHQVAQLHLNPPDLGPLKISISLDQSQASAQFFSAHASVREALEVAMPRLREMLADSGITLGNASVGAEAFREPTQQQARSPVSQLDPVATGSGTVSSGERLIRPMLGLVDTFA